MTLPQFPTLIVEMAFNAGADTANYFTIGDTARGIIGTGAVAPDYPNLDGVFTDITSYVRSLDLASGLSSRVADPILSPEVGQAGLRLDNESRAFDPLNTQSPFFAGASSTTIDVPGPLSNAGVADAVGTAFDAGVSSTSAVTAAAQAATGTGAAFNATVTGSTSGNTPTGQLYGTSHGNNWANTKTLLNPQIVRTYEAFPATYGATSQMVDIQGSISQIASFKPDLTILGDSSAPAYNTFRNQLRAVISGLSDRAHVQHWIIIHHEPVGSGKYADTGYVNTDGNYTLADWQNSQINFRRDVVDFVNTSRTHPIMFTTGHNGFIFTHNKNGAGDWVYDPAPMNIWFSANVRSVLDAYGLDCYGYSASPPHDQFGWGAQYASDHGMPYVVGELGYSVGGTPGQYGDQAELTVAQRVMGQIGAMAVSDRPIGVTWFNGNSSSLLAGWQSTAFWKDVCTNTSVQPT